MIGLNSAHTNTFFVLKTLEVTGAFIHTKASSHKMFRNPKTKDINNSILSSSLISTIYQLMDCQSAYPDAISHLCHCQISKMVY